MKALLALTALTALAAPCSAAACDIGRFPDNPAKAPADVIAIGRVDKQTITTDDPEKLATVPDPHKYTAHAEIIIERVPLGVLAEKSWRLDYPAATPDDWCVFANDGPQLQEGQRVALYFKIIDGKLRSPRWFWEDVARADPRVTKGEPRP